MVQSIVSKFILTSDLTLGNIKNFSYLYIINHLNTMQEIKNYIGQNISAKMDIDKCNNVAILLSDSCNICICHSFNKGLYQYFSIPKCLESLLEWDIPYSFGDILKQERKYNLLCELTDLKESFELC